MATNEDNDRRKIGTRLKETREYLGLSQDEVAKALKMPRPAISLIESGERKVEALELKKFAALFQQSVDYFISGPAEQSKKNPAYLPRVSKDLQQLTKTATELSPQDRNELARFAEYLRAKSKPQ